MRKIALYSLVAGTLLAVLDVLLCVILNKWGLLFYDAFFIGAVFLFASVTSLVTPAGTGGTKHLFQQIYRDNPGSFTSQRRISHRTATICLCIALPNIIVPIITAIIRLEI